ncbi:MAG: TetR/AcrR family transcriptional regulator [Gammaproteobacteria bacterium]|nr:MAG: TetR/AcrR family transcriptional regulator [Gammaproteobacteria bacterium]
MPRTSDKRERLLRSADRLILSQGFRQTTLADIAEDSKVPLGNVYYYFKTKEDICKSVVETRIESMQALLEKCSEPDDPRARLLQLLDYPLTVRTELTDNGCPLGTLSYELSRSEGVLSQSSAQLIEVVLDWARQQFQAMDKPDADELALQLISTLQGMSLVANATRDPGVVDKVISRTRSWLQSL